MDIEAATRGCRAFPLFVLCGAFSWAQPASQTGPAPASRPTAVQTPPPTIKLDLATLPSDKPVELDTPRAQWVNVQLENAVPSARYRVTRTETWSPPRPGMPTDPRTDELRPPGPPTIKRRRDGVEIDHPGCEVFNAAVMSYMQTPIESEVPAALKRLEESETGTCIHSKTNTKVLRDPEWAQVRQGIMAMENDQIHLVIERLGPEDKVARKWDVLLRAGDPDEWRRATVNGTRPTTVIRPRGTKAAQAKAREGNEEEWIVAQIAADIAEMVRLAQNKALRDPLKVTATRQTAGPGLSFVLRLETAERPIEGKASVEEHLWSSKTYAPWALLALEHHKVRAAAETVPGSSLSALLQPTAAVLLAENERVSSLLESRLSAAAAHEQAALLLGAFGLRESAGSMTDVRPSACRMTAHLALASALRGTRPPSPDGAVADAILATLVGRQADALGQVDRLAGKEVTGPVAAWGRALRIRNTGDWRILKEPAKGSLLERREHYRALRTSLDGERAVEFLEQGKPESISDWTRIGFRMPTAVAVGNFFQDGAIPAEVAEITEVSKAVHGLVAPLETLVRSLNEPPGRCVQAPPRKPVAVLGWGLWAYHLQRHLLAAIEATDEHLLDGLGLDQASETLRAKMRQSYGKLVLFPTLERSWDEWGQASCPGMAALTRSSPERTPISAWSTAERLCAKERDAGNLRALAAWADQILPRGTALDAGLRLVTPGLYGKNPRNVRIDYRALHSLAPYEPLIAHTLADETARDPRAGATVKEREAAFGSLMDYNLSAITWTAESAKETPTEYRRLHAKLFALDQNARVRLIEYLHQRGLHAEAVSELEAARKLATDRVALSHWLFILADDYLDRGRTDEALAVAGEAAEVGSSIGVFTLARVMERLGRIDEAERLQKANADRYGNEDLSLESFYVRQAHRFGNKRHEREAAIATKTLFPGGIQKVRLADFVRPPGGDDLVVLMTLDDKRWSKLGMQLADVIVALDGYRIRNWNQLTAVRSWSDEQQLTLIVWRGGHYVEAKGYWPRVAYGPAPRHGAMK